MAAPRPQSIIDLINHLPSWWFHGASWDAWKTVLKATFGLPLDTGERERFATLTGRTSPPTQPVTECWCIVGRRGGKSIVAALIAVYLSCFKQYGALLAPGERGTVMVLARDRRQVEWSSATSPRSSTKSPR